MEVASDFKYMSVEDYLKLEETSPIKHEYVDGCVFAMAGSNRRHNVISGNLFALLHNFLSGTPCRPFIEAMKARVEAANCFYYPDVMVACDNDDLESVYTEHPVLVVETLSPSTAAVDRREKLCNYMKIASLREYLIIHQRLVKVELYRRNARGAWEKREHGAGELLTLESLPNGKLSMMVDALYENGEPKPFRVKEDSQDFEYYMSVEEADALDW